MASAIDEVRQAAVTELRRCIEAFSIIGARWMNVHPDRHTPMHDRAFYIRQNLRSLRELLPDAERYGVGLMIENLPGEYNTAAQLGELLEPLPDLGLHLDIGHANLRVPYNTTEEILAVWGARLRHVHLHDNRGGDADLHLPLGSGNVDVERAVRALKDCGYNETITLEVFTPDRHYLDYSREVLRRVWNRYEAAA
jgi:sugar phosphate isomerase/epimerase